MAGPCACACARVLRLLLASAAIFIALVLVANHVNPCHPRHVGGCGRRLGGVLQGLDADTAREERLEQASALCPSLAETLDCYYWFSQRCLPAREQHYYAKLYVETSAVLSRLCLDSGAGGASSDLISLTGECLAEARFRRGACSARFSDALDHSDYAFSVTDSLYDDEGLGTFKTPFCKALREYLMCALHLVRDTCGLSTALELQDLHANVTQLIFGGKCDIELRPSLAPPQPAMTHFDPTDILWSILTMSLLLPFCFALIIMFKLWK